MKYIHIALFIAYTFTCSSQNSSGMYFRNDTLFIVKADGSTIQVSKNAPVIVSGTTIKTINGSSIVGSGDLTTPFVWGNATGTLSNQTDLQNAINAKQNTITILPFANGGVSSAASTSATTGTMTVNMTSSVITITPTGACTFNGSGGVAGQTVTFAITTSGVSSFTLTWGTNYRKTGTLATGTTSARFFSVTFICIDGTIWQEVSRTGAQT